MPHHADDPNDSDRDTANRIPWHEIAWAAIDAAYDSIMITDAELDAPGPRIRHVNPAFCRMTGYALDEVVGWSPRFLHGPETDRAVLDRLRRDLETGREFQGRTRNYRKDGTPFEIEWTISQVRDNYGETTQYVAVQRDVTERQRLMHLLQQQAIVDPLTESFNRRHGEYVLDTEIARKHRYGQAVSVIMLDIDHFKAINDRYGHAGGDVVLQEIADILRLRLRATDVVCRWGGEEFLAILPNAGIEGACAVGDHLRAHLAEKRYSDGLTVTVSLGVAEGDVGDGRDTLIARADQSLYDAKRSGRNTVTCSRPRGVA